MMLSVIENLFNEHPVITLGLGFFALILAICLLSGVANLIDYIMIFYREYNIFKPKRGDLLKDFDSLFNDNHYVSFSEKEYFEKTYKELYYVLQELMKRYKFWFFDEKKVSKYLLVLETFEDFENKRKTHNASFVNHELVKERYFFDHVLRYPLDNQQRESIVKLEDNCLVISSAGSGKTSTMVGKINYLIKERHISPDKILTITYTRKAAKELSDRINIDGVTCRTFHSIAIEIIKEVTNRKPTICDPNLLEILFTEMMNGDDTFKKAVNTYIIDQQSLMKLEHDYKYTHRYFEDRGKYGITALFTDMDGRVVFTRSEEEKRLVSFLAKNGINFRYEEPYEHDTTNNHYRQYKPDFSIYYNDNYGRRHRIYLEHFGIDKNGNVPEWFADANNYSSWEYANRSYNDGIRWKRDIHRQYNTVLLETTSAMFHDGTVYDNLTIQLQNAGVPIRKLSQDEIYAKLCQRNPVVRRLVIDLITSFLTLAKANEITVMELMRKLETKNDFVSKRNYAVLRDVMLKISNTYESELRRKGQMDFTDAIIKATQLCNEGKWKKYDYILVDEFQDISVDRYKFLQSLRSGFPKTKLYCVGDDWQSIYRFAGSDMTLFYHFEDYFGFTEKCKIETTYRLFNPLLDISSNFIKQNPNQLVKEVHSNPKVFGQSDIHFVDYLGNQDKNNVYKYEKEQIINIVNQTPSQESIIILGRYKYDAIVMGVHVNSSNEKENIVITVNGRSIPFLTIHTAKGLEADNIILLNCNAGTYGFPSTISDDPILNLVLSKSDSYPYAEERRLFYVALTRAKKNIYVLYNNDQPSVFVKELRPAAKEGEIICPVCGSGRIVSTGKNGNDSRGSYTLYCCTNHSAGCSYIRRVYTGNRPTGIIVRNGMTQKDIETYIIRNHHGPIPVSKVYPPGWNTGWYNTPSIPNSSEGDDLLDDLPF